jgi:hypothetical protein
MPFIPSNPMPFLALRPNGPTEHSPGLRPKADARGNVPKFRAA